MSGENGSGTGTVNDAEWKTKPPYSIHSDNNGFDALYEAHCHCGRVRYQLNRKEPLSSKYCHCSTCQTQHGAPFQWAAIFEKTDINFSHGHHNLEWYDPGSKSIAHKLPCKVRCSFCHSPIMDEGRNMILLFPTLIDFKSEAEKRRFAATMHMFYAERVVDIKDGLPKWAGQNDKSDLIEDSPPEAIEAYKKKQEEQQDEEAEEEEEHPRKKQKTETESNGNGDGNDDGGKGHNLRNH